MLVAKGELRVKRRFSKRNAKSCLGVSCIFVAKVLKISPVAPIAPIASIALDARVFRTENPRRFIVRKARESSLGERGTRERFALKEMVDSFKSHLLQGLSTVSEAAISGARDSRAIIFRQARKKGISGFEECAHWRAASLTVLTPCSTQG